MLKIRLMGTKSDIAWFQKILSSNNKIEVLEISELYSNKGILQCLCTSAESKFEKRQLKQ